MGSKHHSLAWHNMAYHKHLAYMASQAHSLATMGSKYSSLAMHSLEACSSIHNMAYHKHLANMACK